MSPAAAGLSLETIMGFTFSVAACLNSLEMFEGIGGGSGAEFHILTSVSGKLSGEEQQQSFQTYI